MYTIYYLYFVYFKLNIFREYFYKIGRAYNYVNISIYIVNQNETIVKRPV